VVLAATLPSAGVRRRHTIDWAGAGLLAGAVSGLVLFADLGGTILPWGSPTLLGIGLGSAVLLLLFVRVERRAAEPVLPPRLFADSVFRVTSAIGLTVGLALFGSVTYMPLFLQAVKGSSPTASGLELLPQMLGTLATSIVSGHLISRWGRYRIFPILGTAVLSIGLLLLSRMHVETSRLVISLSLLTVGLGLGMVMQVLVLVVQNAVPYEDLGVATSGATLFRFVGASLGTAVLGAIFAARLSDELAALGLGTMSGEAGRIDPSSLAGLTAEVRQGYLEALTASIDTVFLVAAVMTAVGFVLAWMLEERPLRDAVAAGSRGGESLPVPHAGDSLSEVSQWLWGLLSRENKRRLLERIAAEAGVDLSAAAVWLLARFREDPQATPGDLAQRYKIEVTRLESGLSELRRQGLVERDSGMLTPAAGPVLARLIDARRNILSRLLADWSPETHRDLEDFLQRVARDLAPEAPGR
jgi:DNA-binding MarR family transcriptional regulator